MENEKAVLDRVKTKAMFGSVEGEGREEKEKGKENKKERKKKVFSQVCLDTKRKRKER